MVRPSDEDLADAVLVPWCYDYRIECVFDVYWLCWLTMTNIWLRYVTGISIHMTYVYVHDYDLWCDTSMILCPSLWYYVYVHISVLLYDVYVILWSYMIDLWLNMT